VFNKEEEGNGAPEKPAPETGPQAEAQVCPDEQVPPENGQPPGEAPDGGDQLSVWKFETEVAQPRPGMNRIKLFFVFFATDA